MILVFGKTGQIATALHRLRPDAQFLGRDEADLVAPENCARLIRHHAPTAVINAAAYTAVDRAEDEPALAAVINAQAPAAMARACADLDIPFVHVSTDYVFDGRGTAPFAPAHPAAPLNTYGRTKLEGENQIRAIGGRYVILRTSWVFSAQGRNFVKTMLELSRTRAALTIIDDQIGGPTPARALAAASLTIADQLTRDAGKAGTYHFSGTPDLSWCDFAKAIFKASGRAIRVTPIPTRSYPTAAQRPLNSRLECQSTADSFGLARPDWQHDLGDILNELKEVN